MSDDTHIEMPTTIEGWRIHSVKQSREIYSLRDRLAKHELIFAQIMEACGVDLDGDTPEQFVRHGHTPPLSEQALRAARELRRDYDEALGEII